MEPTRADIRRTILDTLTMSRPPTQYAGLQTGAAQALADRGFDEGVYQNPMGATLQGRTEQQFREVVWDLIASGILVPGLNASNQEWPWLSLTEAGRELAGADPPTPADPEGIVAHVRELLSAEDDRVVPYLEEAVGAFNRRLYLAATVMLGTAAEGLVLRLAEAIARSKPSPEGEQWLRERVEGAFALARLRRVRGEIEALRDELPRDLREALETYWGSIHGLLRMERNEAGHPSGVRRSREEVLPSLLLFPILVGIVRKMERWLEGRSTSAT